ncbi:hypothetical protein OPT61_g10394 [Boeremia exigua]|uniref:Uncharacterized protein n=1 Tax=Boeremia exigua TaxID=749465 RepID=A0ACC2HQ33_9PLEO|nr:hypothetical protein OPT61_g10394 [Boeremia exigua]
MRRALLETRSFTIALSGYIWRPRPREPAPCAATLWPQRPPLDSTQDTLDALETAVSVVCQQPISAPTLASGRACNAPFLAQADADAAA